MPRCDHIYVIQTQIVLPNGKTRTTYRCGRCGDTYSEDT